MPHLRPPSENPAMSGDKSNTRDRDRGRTKVNVDYERLCWTTALGSLCG